MFLKYARTRTIFLSLIAVFSLFISNVSFAGPNEDLLDAIAKDDIAAATKILEAGGVDFEKIDVFSALPSPEMCDMLAKNGCVVPYSEDFFRSILEGLNSEDALFRSKTKKLIEWVLGRYIGQLKTILSSDTLQKMLDNSIDPNLVLPYISYLPCYEQAEVDIRNNLVRNALGKNRANSNRFLEMVVNQSVMDNKGTHNNIGMIERQSDLIKIALDKGAKFYAIKIYNNCQFPSDPETAKFIMDHDPNKFIEILLKVSCKDGSIYDPDVSRSNEEIEEDFKKMLYAINLALTKGASLDRLLELAINQLWQYDGYCENVLKSRFLDSVIDMALAKGANPNKIRYFYGLHSIDLAKVLFQHGMKADVYFDLVSRTFSVRYIGPEGAGSYEVDDEVIKQKDQLLEYALKKGAVKPNKKGYFAIGGFLKLIDEVNQSDNWAANIDLRQKDGKTLLMLAAEGGYVGLVVHALDAGADRDKKDNQGKTALDLARQAGNSNEYLDELLGGYKKYKKQKPSLAERIISKFILFPPGSIDE